jgi:hypothetical protein
VRRQSRRFGTSRQSRGAQDELRRKRDLALPAGSALTLFAIGRTIGWIAHAIEQYAQDAMIRPRAKYVGPRNAS